MTHRDPEKAPSIPTNVAPRAAYVTPSLRRFGHLADVTRSTDMMGGPDGGLMSGMSRT